VSLYNHAAAVRPCPGRCPGKVSAESAISATVAAGRTMASASRRRRLHWSMGTPDGVAFAGLAGAAGPGPCAGVSLYLGGRWWRRFHLGPSVSGNFTKPMRGNQGRAS